MCVHMCVSLCVCVCMCPHPEMQYSTHDSWAVRYESVRQSLRWHLPAAPYTLHTEEQEHSYTLNTGGIVSDKLSNVENEY